MEKQAGMGSNLYVDEYDISGDIGAIATILGARRLLDVTDITQSGIARIGGLREGEIAYTAFWDTVADAEHLAFRSLPTTDRIMSVFLGATVGSAAASIVTKQMGYGPNRGPDGSLIASIRGLSNAHGLEWSGGATGDGMLTTGKQTFASGTINGTSVNLGSTSTLFGAAGYLHVFSLGSGTPTVTIADSANDSTFTPITGMAFAAITAPTKERIQSATDATIRQYVRVQPTGTYTHLICAVNFVRYSASIAT